MSVLWLVVLFARISLAALTATEIIAKAKSDLIPKLSQAGIISFQDPLRWSEYHAPDPAVVVNVKSEADVQLTVLFCNTFGIPFLAQNGGNGWATTFTLHNDGVLINLAGLNKVTFNADKTQATIGGGASINATIQAANKAGALVETGNCNCVGVLGAYLGGGYGNLIGLYGLGVDQIISARLVTADGKLRTVSASDADLFWAIRGAGPNFGIVTSAVVKSYPATAAQRSAWTGALIFTPDKLEQVVQAIQDLNLKPEMSIFMYFTSSGPPTNAPVVLTTPYLYKGDAASGQAAFASLYAIGPIADTTSVLLYDQWNTGGDQFCTHSGRKPSFSAGIQTMIPSVWRQIWNEYTAFQAKPGAQNSIVLLEAYSLGKVRSLPSSSTAFPHRDVNFNAVAIPWYSDASYDQAAVIFGQKARSLWRASDGLGDNSTYINFANGDEDLSHVYGESLARLRTIKKQIDPQNRFNQWFDIK
ncbi:FAD binding domain-containing protein [Bimuria novae-zelandiae CBS 107.79]|uniref:FAD binding domain-containing protein n=1 Tax=Bimuria novae-zelandiae CBS 107.79 TaxID=1447943 RepID=A0A6A5V4K1_9PLEO|nr:FAD binding domain-containing protein [Bimuria novae-zelandiae CBS 107.79]